MTQLRFPAGLDPASFLEQFWQKRPFFMQGALPDLQDGLTPDELAGLALEPDVEARLVRQDRDHQFTLVESPFVPADFSHLPAEGWTLLVQDVDKHLPELASFLDIFSFLPSWRFDDLMISAAAPGGGVGPHIDQYDVFLCQVTGHRRWSIGQPGHYKERRGSPLRQIEHFEVSDSMLLGPGDVLYLPPGIPHDGVAEDLCTTWSVGFRAPSQFDLIGELIPARQCEAADSARYSDADLLLEEVQDGLISMAALGRFRDLLGGLCDVPDEELLPRIGQYLTQPKPWLRAEPPEQPIRAEALVQRMHSGEALTRHGMAPFARAAFDQRHWLFASGKSVALEPSAWFLARRLCSHRRHGAEALEKYMEQPRTLLLLTTLYNDGQLLLDDDL